MEYLISKIIKNEEISEGIFSLWVSHKADIKPGQFYMLKGEKAFLGRPISVCETKGQEVRFVYAVVGKGTNELKSLKAGEEIKIIGPLGNGFNSNKDYKKVALVSGGIGVAPMVELAKKLSGNFGSENIDFYGGFRDKVYLNDEIEKYVSKSFITTNSGEVGIKGFVTEPLLKNIKNYDTVLCCGPEIMMKRVVEICKENEVEVYISMEKHMACGVGACLVCTCKTKEGNKRTCKDGPVFNGLDVEF